MSHLRTPQFTLASPLQTASLPGPRACGYFKAAGKKACIRHRGTQKQANKIYAIEIDTFRLWAADVPDLRQKTENALATGSKLVTWKQELSRRFISGETLERGLSVLRGLANQPEVAKPKLILRTIVSQAVDQVFDHDTKELSNSDQIDCKPSRSEIEGLRTDIHEAIERCCNELDTKIVLLAAKGHSFRRIASELGISKSNAQQRYAKVMTTLAARLKDYRQDVSRSRSR